MEDKIIEVINHVRNKKKGHVTKEKIFNLITKTNISIDQGHLMEAFESMKANGVIFLFRKENENLILLIIRITIHGSLVINHQQK